MALLRSESNPYLNDLDYRSNSPSNKPLNLAANSPFESYEFGHLSPPFPHTPSYNGSYQNSPYSGHSELSYDPDGPEAFGGLFDRDANNVASRDEYDPSEYDPPNSSGLLMFQSEYIPEVDHNSLSVSRAPFDNRPPNAFDHSSPSSNGGGDEPRSRASSVSSNPQIPTSSPRLDMAHSFENLHFESPHWQLHNLPGDRPMSPPRKPQSPPQLLIPDSSPATRSLFPQDPPMINAPDGDGGFTSSGPQLHIVPATPISGGGAASQAVPFQSTLKTLHQGSTQNAPQQQVATPPWDQQQIQHTEGSQLLGVSQQGTQQYPHSHSSHTQGLSTLGPHPDPTNTSFLFPGTNPRIRSKSDTSSSLRPTFWDSSLMTHEQLRALNSSAIDDNGTVNLSDVLPQHQHQSQHPSSTSANQTSFNNSSHTQQQQFNFGNPNTPSNMNYLTPDAIALRRSKSDSGSRPTHNRLSRSEDISHSSPLLFPPSSHTDLINRQYLYPQETVQSIRMHNRRASSGSRGGNDGSWSGLSSNRPSPYPSPSASPRVRYDDLPNVSLAGRPSMLRPDPAQTMASQISVTKQTVTSERTAGASHRRRKQDANFLCPVPGCGSTFTRSFNLKGHMRSHNEERPFQCKWPGCGKGFARQHDCKRHEQLHSNYRPFTCDGCNKTFARMDALNRHLRSEGGADCQRILDAAKQESDHGPVPKTEENGWTSMSVMV